MRSQVISFLRAFLHRIGLQDFLAVPQANVTSALNRLSLIMSPLKHMLMLCTVQAAEPDQGGTLHTCRAPACPYSAQSHDALASRVIQTIEVALS